MKKPVSPAQDPRPDPRISELVGVARELALEAGFEAAAKLMMHFGGQRRNLPAKMRPSSPFWKVLGKDAALALAAIAARPRRDGSAGDDAIDIPIGSRLQASQRRRAIGNFNGSKNQAAERFGVSRRTVQRIRNQKPAPIPLFDGHSKRS